MACGLGRINTSYIRESFDVWGLLNANTSSWRWGRSKSGDEMKVRKSITDRSPASVPKRSQLRINWVGKVELISCLLWCVLCWLLWKEEWDGAPIIGFSFLLNTNIKQNIWELILQVNREYFNLNLSFLTSIQELTNFSKSGFEAPHFAFLYFQMLHLTHFSK